MGDQVRFGEFQHSNAGVVRITKGAAVRAWVSSEASRIAAEASAAAASRRASLPQSVRHGLRAHDPDALSAPAYEPVVKAGGFDTLGVVRPATLEGVHDQNQNHTLDRYKR